MARRNNRPTRPRSTYARHKQAGRKVLMIPLPVEEYNQVAAAAAAEMRSVTQYVRITAVRGAGVTLALVRRAKKGGVK